MILNCKVSVVMSLRSILQTTVCKLSRISRSNSTTSGGKGSMLAWQINAYGDNHQLQMGKKPIPAVVKPNQILIKVRAASINPLDFRMRQGYGATALNQARKMSGAAIDFHFILGRDCSGVVVDVGNKVSHVQRGDEVWAAVSQFKQGTHAQYVLVDDNEISIKPKNLTHIEAASIPYVAITAWSALYTSAGLRPENTSGKRVLVHAGAGGVGSFAIQMLRAWGADVTTTCSTSAIQLVTDLGAHHVVDYKTQNAKRELRRMGGFDVILDTVGGQTEEYSLGLLRKNGSAKYVSLRSPIFAEIDSLGLVRGGLSAGWQMLQKTAKFGTKFSWAFGTPNKEALEHVKVLVEKDQVKAVIDKVFDFDELPAAMAYVEKGGARGKTVVDVDKGSD